jgi:hypothetical protein
MRFLAGVVVGIVIGRPILNVVNDHLTPPVRRKITEVVNNLAASLNARIEPEENNR